MRLLGVRRLSRGFLRIRLSWDREGVREFLDSGRLEPGRRLHGKAKDLGPDALLRLRFVPGTPLAHGSGSYDAGLRRGEIPVLSRGVHLQLAEGAARYGASEGRGEMVRRCIEPRDDRATQL